MILLLIYMLTVAHGELLPSHFVILGCELILMMLWLWVAVFLSLELLASARHPREYPIPGLLFM